MAPAGYTLLDPHLQTSRTIDSVKNCLICVLAAAVAVLLFIRQDSHATVGAPLTNHVEDPVRSYSKHHTPTRARSATVQRILEMTILKN